MRSGIISYLNFVSLPSPSPVGSDDDSNNKDENEKLCSNLEEKIKTMLEKEEVHVIPLFCLLLDVLSELTVDKLSS